jgi:hypothetical protein
VPTKNEKKKHFYTGSLKMKPKEALKCEKLMKDRRQVMAKVHIVFDKVT